MVKANGSGGSVTARRLAVRAIGLTWLVLAGVVGLGSLRLRVQVREQILGRDGEILMAYARTLQTEELDEVLAEDPLAVLIAMARLNGIFAARLFETDGRFVWSMPATLDDEDGVPPSILERVREGAAVGRFQTDFSLAGLSLSTNLNFWPEATNAAPVVEVWVLLQGRSGKEFKGVAKSSLRWIGSGPGVCAPGSPAGLRDRDGARGRVSATGGAIGWAFRRLERSHRLLARRTEALQQANQELARSARVTALGAVTAHLVHGLKNPMLGLQSFVAARPETGATDEGAWADARAAAGRMQALIEQVVRVLREEASDLTYEVSLHEVGEAVTARVRTRAEARGVRVELQGNPPGEIDNRRSGLLALIVTNLVENAVDATPRGGTVTLRLDSGAGGWLVDVVDAGPGLPEAVRERLFQPQPSTKEGGSGWDRPSRGSWRLPWGGGSVFSPQAQMEASFESNCPMPEREAGARREGRRDPPRGLRCSRILPEPWARWRFALLVWLPGFFGPDRLRLRPGTARVPLVSSPTAREQHRRPGSSRRAVPPRHRPWRPLFEFEPGDLDRRISGTSKDLRGAAWMGNRLLITGEEGTALWSDDGVGFQPAAVVPPTTDWLEGVAATEAVAIAVGDNGAGRPGRPTDWPGPGWRRN